MRNVEKIKKHGFPCYICCQNATWEFGVKVSGDGIHVPYMGKDDVL